MIRGTGFFCHFKSLLFKHELPECNLFVPLAFGHYDVLRCCAGVGCRQAAAALLPERGAGAAAPALSRAAAQAAHAHLTAHAGILCWKEARCCVTLLRHALVMQEAYRLQLRCFQSMVQEQQHLPSLKQLLKLYTAISLPKLASLMDMNETTLRSQLMLLKVSLLLLNSDSTLAKQCCCNLRPVSIFLSQVLKHLLQPAHAAKSCRPASSA